VWGRCALLIIYAVGLTGKPYKVTITKPDLDKMNEVKITKKIGSWYPFVVYSLMDRVDVSASITLSVNEMNVIINEGSHRAKLCDVDLRAIDDDEIYITNMFKILLPENVFYLNDDDLTLIKDTLVELTNKLKMESEFMPR
jgi:hypothetical protein